MYAIQTYLILGVDNIMSLYLTKRLPKKVYRQKCVFGIDSTFFSDQFYFLSFFCKFLQRTNREQIDKQCFTYLPIRLLKSTVIHKNKSMVHCFSVLWKKCSLVLLKCIFF